MENASKALMIAAGMLMAILIVTLLIYARNKFSEYQSSQDELAEIEDTAEFNEQFSEYNRDDVEGYELLSLIYKVIDYNERKSNDTVNGNNEQDNLISLTVNMVNSKKFSYNETENYLFEQSSYTADNLVKVNLTTNQRATFKDDIEYKVEKDLTEIFGENVDSQKLTSLAKSIGSIFLTEDEIRAKANSSTYGGSEENVKKDMLTKYKNITGQDTDIKNLIIPDNKKTTEKKSLYYKVCQCYEYMQFKRGIFKCNEITYNSNTNRVDSITFTFTGKLH